MSTKIYNGFKFKNPNPFVIRKQLIVFQKHIRDITRRIYANLQAQHVSAIFDDTYHKRRDYSPNILNESHGEMIKYLKEFNDHESPFQCQIGIYPISSNKTLGQFFCLHHYEEHIRQAPWFIEYHYQNQCDKPEEISARQWSQRQKDWNVVFDESWIPTSAGFFINLQNPRANNAYIHPKLIIDRIPTYRKRLEALTTRIILGESKESDLYKFFMSDDFKDKQKSLMSNLKLKRRIALRDVSNFKRYPNLHRGWF